jgi:hypothetical protein
VEGSCYFQSLSAGFQEYKKTMKKDGNMDDVLLYETDDYFHTKKSGCVFKSSSRLLLFVVHLHGQGSVVQYVCTYTQGRNQQNSYT